MPIPSKRRDEDDKRFMSIIEAADFLSFGGDGLDGFTEEEKAIVKRLTQMLKDWKDKQHPYFKDLAGYVAELMIKEQQ